ncbi:hypothetical protein B0H21DRAFT_876506 [Amylocystis lapponica]|nr:hypothetical protein B0H21DRAFT_876506 [Amylocystis lapponica]
MYLIPSPAIVAVLTLENSDPCAAIAGQTYVAPADAMACLTSFPFNETLRQNVLTVVSRVFDFYTFEDYYLHSPPPFQASTVNIRAELSRINSTAYDSDYAFNRDLYNVVNNLNDGHTRWIPNCYTTYQNLLPAPVVTIEMDGTQNVYISPNAVSFISSVGSGYTSYLDSAPVNFDWKPLAAAQVLQIEGMDAYDYVDHIADTETGNYLDHSIRVNSVFSSYRIVETAFSQRFGDLAGPSFPDRNNLTMTVALSNSTANQTVVIPYVASFLGSSFTDQASYWAANCAANDATNGVDNLNGRAGTVNKGLFARQQPRGVIVNRPSSVGYVALPNHYLPNLPSTEGSEGVIKSFILPDNITGVMFVGSFEPNDPVGFQKDVVSAISQFQSSGVTRLLIDLTNNGGGYVCLGQFLHQYLAGSNIGYPGFQSASRANPLAQKILASDIALGVTYNMSFYAPDNWAFLNNTVQPNTYNYNNPSVSRTINNVLYSESQRFFDACEPFAVTVPETAPFDLNNVAIVGNGDCASTCAMFSTLMFERHNTSIAVFGGRPGDAIQYKGMAGNQVLEWVDIDSEIKTAGLKDDPLAPPDLLVSGNFRHNWRTAYSYFDEEVPIAYESELPQYRFPYTIDTYMNPQNLWVYAASQLFD